MDTKPVMRHCGICDKDTTAPCYDFDEARGCSNLTYAKPKASDPVNHPAHYNAGKVETIDYIMQVAKTYPGDEAVLVGNVLKYVSRAQLKGKKVEDLKKAQWYLNRLLDDLS